MVSSEMQHYAHSSVLCWLATVNNDGMPNVSPKEIWHLETDHSLLIANIASPQSVANILEQPQVCVSFIDIFSQKGYQLKGKASILTPEMAGYGEKLEPLYALAGDAYPIRSIIAVEVKQHKDILAPSYFLFPERSEAERRADAMHSYGVQAL